MLRLIRLFGVFSMLSIMLNAGAAPILQIEDGKLVGAKGIHIGTRLFDVRFREGTCAQVYGTCDSSGFLFGSFEEAVAASLSLLNDVLVDVDSGAFDSDPTLTYGIGPVCGMQCGQISTPYMDLGMHVSVVTAYNRAGLEPDLLGGGDIFKPNTSLGDPDGVWAVWTARSQSVPEPTSLALIGLGVAAYAGVRRKGPSGGSTRT
jgi:hypothetical protein